ncbi:MAG: hypothetical protein HZA51_17885 [Planctomycetes bacterium]|nr:hypothetical protein [Planctomycetota bacterium]
MTRSYIPQQTSPASHGAICRGILAKILDGSDFAPCMMPWGSFGPIRFADGSECEALIDAHLRGGPAVVTFAPFDKQPKRVRIDALQLGSYCPAADGLCRWFAFDLDGASHGAGGLADVDRAAATLWERIDSFGGWRGSIVVRSRSGSGRHIWAFPPKPISLADACAAVAFLAAAANMVAARDYSDSDAMLPNAFTTASGVLATMGKSGAIELIPKSTTRPDRGYSLALPFGAVAARNGGGVAVDPFASHPAPIIEPETVPSWTPATWEIFMADVRRELARIESRRQPAKRRPAFHPDRIRKLDPRTQSLIDGTMREGERNKAIYYGVGDLIRSGIPEAEAERMIVSGAVRCGVSQREAEATIRSARRKAVRK